MKEMQQIRQEAASVANAEDASIWRWLSALVEERRIRWCCSGESWLVSVDHRHVATESNFDRAIRQAKATADRRGLGTLERAVAHRGQSA